MKPGREHRTARKVTGRAVPRMVAPFWCQCLYFWHLRNNGGLEWGAVTTSVDRKKA